MDYISIFTHIQAISLKSLILCTTIDREYIIFTKYNIIEIKQK